MTTELKMCILLFSIQIKVKIIVKLNYLVIHMRQQQQLRTIVIYLSSYK